MDDNAIAVLTELRDQRTLTLGALNDYRKSEPPAIQFQREADALTAALASQAQLAAVTAELDAALLDVARLTALLAEQSAMQSILETELVDTIAIGGSAGAIRCSDPGAHVAALKANAITVYRAMVAEARAAHQQAEGEEGEDEAR